MKKNNQLSFDILNEQSSKLMDIKEAALWATDYLQRKVTASNISYLLQYGKITRYGNNGNPLIDKDELKRPVLCRVEKDKERPYIESIFHFKRR